MKVILQFFLLFSVILNFETWAQAPQYCGFDLMLNSLDDKYPGLRQACNAQYATTVQQALSNRGERSTVYEIPVVFHVVYKTPQQNVADEVVEDQMAILNQDFRRLNPDTVDTREVFLPVAADAEIEFVLATEDPDGNPTNGIIHYQTEVDSFLVSLFDGPLTDSVKYAASGGADAWDTERYLNIWVCNLGCSEDYGVDYTPFGIAVPLFAADEWADIPAWQTDYWSEFEEVDGIILDYHSVGSNNPAVFWDGDSWLPGGEGGRILTHEVGHYLGLRHTWGDAGWNENGCGVDDYIPDTPNCAVSNGYENPCNFDANTCNDGFSDFPDQAENYMDYNLATCLNMFTNDQKALMRFNLEQYRPGLIESQLLSLAEVQKVALDMWPNPAKKTVNVHSDHAGQVKIVDLGGRVVVEEKLGPGKTQLNVEGLTNGLYTVVFHSELITTVKKLILSR